MTGTGTAWAHRPRTAAAKETSERGKPSLASSRECQRANTGDAQLTLERQYREEHTSHYGN
ncbi:GD11330 [Drosophila simulans]|uniref:GD11330 n=1 Tax=Drosophila simulans TaxID=7240 RepID=B4NVV8_DROSI|nr:GD11330 [Drosophila simulans]